jgi:hypothetical protein
MMPVSTGWMRWPFTGLSAGLLVGGVATGLAFWLATGSMVHVLLVYSILVVMSLRPFPMMFGFEHATEFVLFLGFARRRLAARYLLDFFLRSLVHSIAIFLAWCATGIQEHPRLGLREPHLHLDAFVLVLCTQVLVRSTWVTLMTLPSATCLPKWVRDQFTGNSKLPWILILVPFVVSGSGIAMGLLVRNSSPLSLLPIALGSFLGLVVTTLSAEFSGGSRRARRTSYAKTTWRRPRHSPLAALGWFGLSRWVWASLILFLVPAGVAAAARIFWPSRVIEMESPVLMLGFWGLEAWLVILMWFGGKVYRWSASGASAEFLHMAGSSVPRLRRVKLATAGVIILLAAGIVFFVIPALDQARVPTYLATQFLRGSISLLFMAGAAQVLLRMNECPLAVRRGSAVTGADLARIAWGATCLLLVSGFVVERVGGIGLKEQTFPWMFAGGLLLFAPALALWVGASDESAGRG